MTDVHGMREECLEAILRFHRAEGRLPKNSEITTPAGRRAGLPSRARFDRAFGRQDDEGRWIRGWFPAVAAYEQMLLRMPEAERPKGR